MSLTMTDMFCGAGGSSTGATMIPGISVKTALNHWQKALDSHNANHPDTIHVQADIKETDPRYIGNSDILWASPECTNHSVAKGKKRITNQADLFGDTLPDEAAVGTNAPKDVGQPLDTFAANGLHHGLAEWKIPEVDDCEFRMLEPHEIKAGMAFPKEYIMLGNKREQVKMAGNAVTPPAARDLVACMAETLAA